MAKQKKINSQKYSDIKSTHPVLCPDGKYRWVYDVPMLKNPSILLEVYWVLGVSFGIVWFFVLMLGGCESNFKLSELWDITRGFLILMAVFLVLGFIAYFFVSWYYGWKYVVLFTMDQTEIIHQQMPYQVKKAQVLGALAAMVGGATGSLGMVGTGVLAASRSTSTSTLAQVNSLVPVRQMNLIKVNQGLHKNRIYVPDEDFDFVYDFLCQQCINAKD